MNRKRSQILLPVLIFCTILSLVACAAPISPAAAPAAEATTAPAEDSATAEEVSPEMAELIAAAQAEGTLTTIALPHDWCNYGGVLQGFKDKYGLTINELNPDAGSGDELEAIRVNKDNTGPQAPDVIDVGFAFGPIAKEEGLIQPYKVATWDTIPDDVKDPDGYYYGDYYGVLSFIINKDVVTGDNPTDWADLLDPAYASAVGLSGDPRVSNQAILSVLAAALSSSGSMDDTAPGLDYFAQLNSAGNLVPTISNNALLARGETPVRIAWDYLGLSAADELAGNPPVEVVIPETGRLGGVYLQAISAYAPHPNAAKLWMEYLYSDEGQIKWMEGYCHPIREADMRARGVIPEELASKLPDVSGAEFPTVAQQDAAKALIAEQWDSVVGANIQAGE